MARIEPIPTRRWHGNTCYPLPPTYLDTVLRADHDPEAMEEARKIRVNACRQWAIPRADAALALSEVVPGWADLSYEEKQALIDVYKADAFVASMSLFDEYYLKPDPEVGFDPMFYDDTPLPTPEFHKDIIRDWAVNASTLTIAPRGSAKSSLHRKAFPLVMLTSTNYSIVYCTSSEKNAMVTAEAVRTQVYTNPRIKEDFGPEMPNGYIKPRRAEAPTGIEHFKLTNGSQLVTYSATSKMRGVRPKWFALDDPEYDPQASTSMGIIRSYMHRLLFKIAMPMVMRKEAKLTWTATFVSKRHYAFMAMETTPIVEDGVVRQVAKLPEFDYWKRRLVKAVVPNDAGVLESTWPHMWPVDEVQKRALNLDSSTKTIPEIRQRIGAANFNSEYMGNPGSSDETYFVATERRHGWDVLAGTVDEDFAKEPRKSLAVIRWRSGDEERSARLCDFLKDARLFITMDTSKTAKADSDYKVCTLMAVNKEHDLFILDTWASQCHPDKLIAAAFAMSARWGCRWLWPELIDDGIVLARTMKNMVGQMMKDGTPASALPVVKGFNPGYASKSSKIGALLMRFEHGKIKLPFMWRARKPWVDLFDQIEGFNPDADDGGLQNDDLLDTVSMSEYVMGGKSLRDGPAPEEEKTVVEMIESGERFDKYGTNLGEHIDIHALSIDQLRKVAAALASGPKSGDAMW